jgi:hypothetical protein
MYRMTTQQKISAAKCRVEDAALELIAYVEQWPTSPAVGPNVLRDKRGTLLRMARGYGSAVDRLTRVRK